MAEACYWENGQNLLVKQDSIWFSIIEDGMFCLVGFNISLDAFRWLRSNEVGRRLS